MPLPKTPPKVPLFSDADRPTIDEARMRRALDLDAAPDVPCPEQARSGQMRPEQARVRHRFVRDGEVPVEVVNGHNARADAERALAEARAAVQALRTQLAHAEMAHAEALAAERRAREAAEAALRDAIEAREAVERRLREEATAATSAVRAPAAAPVLAPKRLRAAGPVWEPEPVQWWLSGWKSRSQEGR